MLKKQSPVVPAGSFGFDSMIVVARSEASTLRCGPAVTAALLKFDISDGVHVDFALMVLR